jgi:hypothetical protein
VPGVTNDVEQATAPINRSWRDVRAGGITCARRRFVHMLRYRIRIMRPDGPSCLRMRTDIAGPPIVMPTCRDAGGG